jgi:hypothetical protein
VIDGWTRGVGIVVAAALSLSLAACSTQPETIDTAYGTGRAVYWGTGDLDVIVFPDGSIGLPKLDGGHGLAFVNHPSGEVTWYEDDGRTVGGTFVSDGGAHLVRGGTTTQDAMATMGEEFTYTATGGWSTITGTPMGVVQAPAATEGDPGQCFFTYFSFQVTAPDADGGTGAVLTYAPKPAYVVDGVTKFQHEFSLKIDRRRFGLCDSDRFITNRFRPILPDAALGATYYSAEAIYVPEGGSFDGIVIGFYEGPRVYYAPMFLDAPPMGVHPRTR